MTFYINDMKLKHFDVRSFLSAYMLACGLGMAFCEGRKMECRYISTTPH